MVDELVPVDVEVEVLVAVEEDVEVLTKGRTAAVCVFGSYSQLATSLWLANIIVCLHSSCCCFMFATGYAGL